MYFTECANLADRHPALAGVIQQIDAQLQDIGTAEVLRVGDFASFLGADPNRVTSVFEMLAEDGLLDGEEMIECPYCKMAVRRSEYDHTLEEEGECCCTDCDRPLIPAPGQVITTYRRGKKWKEPPAPQEPPRSIDVVEVGSAPVPTGVVLDDQAWYTHDRLAEVFEVGKDALRKRLEKYRSKNLDGWKENEDRRPREPKYLYQLKMVRHIIDELRASSERPAK